MANKKENIKNLAKRMFLSISMMSFFVSAGIENASAMEQNSIFGEVNKGRSDNKSRRNAVPVPAPSAPMPALAAAKQDKSGYRLAVPDSPTPDPKTGVGGNSLIIKDLNEESDTNNDKNTILEKVENNSVTGIPKNILDIIDKINTADLCSKEMLKLCDIICMEGYQAKRKNLEPVLSQNITASAVDVLLKDNSNTQIFKAALLSIALGVYHDNQAEKIFSEKINDPLMRISAIDRKNEFDNALSYCRMNADSAFANIKVYTDFVNCLIGYMCYM